ncbi:MAG TPA: hypothetical protein VK679_09710 [Gemmatimonadaceae bacterium]|jgi:hypothetical protein|nr:hypothetical protein [Gemmatimonadaceae bacterium]
MRPPTTLGIATAGLVLALVACSADHTTPTQPTAPTPSPVPQDTLTPLAFDLRFKGVGVLSDTIELEGSDVDVGLGQSFANAAGTPLEIGSAGNCVVSVPFDCAWLFTVFALPAKTTGLTTFYDGISLANFASIVDTTSATDTVITSLDIQPANGSLGFVEQTLSGGGYTPKSRTVAPSAVQAAATQEGAAGRVITALALDSGQVRYLSYGWQHAASAVYDAQVSTATFATVGSASATLANAGYVITAFGGDSADGFTLVGTRVHGSTTPHSIVIDTTATGHPGYTIVAAFDAILSSVVFTEWIEER